MELVYFLQADTTDMVKIGWTSDIVARVQKLRVACPYDAKLLGVRPGTPQLEGAYHSHFSGRRKHGEWFSFSYEEINWLAISMRAQFAEAWSFVEAEFNSRAAHLRSIPDRFGVKHDILFYAYSDVAESLDMHRSPKVVLAGARKLESLEQEGGAE